MKLRRVPAVLGAALATVILVAGAAAAHTSVILDESDQDPQEAPHVLDGTDEVNFFGVLPNDGDVRSFQLSFDAGEPVNATLVVPNLSPENTLAAKDLPVVSVCPPSGRCAKLKPYMREEFTSGGPFPLELLRLGEYSTKAKKSGTYSITVRGRAPERFVILTGTEGNEEFHGMERGEPATQEQITDWYNTAP